MSENTTNLIETGCGFSKAVNPREAGVQAAHQALKSIERYPVSVVLVFASVRFDPTDLIAGIRSVTGRAPLIGASTAGEICNGLLIGSVVVTVFASPYLDVHAAVGKHVSMDWQAAVDEAARSPEIRPYFSPSDFSHENFLTTLRRKGKSVFGILFSPGNTRTADSKSRDILLALRKRSRSLINFCGGGSADDWRLEKNHVFLDDQAYEDSMLVAIFETQLQTGMGIAHGFSPSNKKMLVTRAQENVVLEINHEPADEAYCTLIGKTPSEMTGKHLTLVTGKPVGLNDPFGEFIINVPSFLTKNGGVRFSQPVAEGSQLILMNGDPDTLIHAGRQALQKALFRGDIKRPAATLVFSCALRYKILKEKIAEEIEGIRDMARYANISGFLSFGEQGLSDNSGNCHGNALVSVLAIGGNLTPAADVWFENQRLIKEKEWAKKALVEANAFREAVIDRAAEGLCVFHEIDRYPYIRFDIWNQRMTEITGYRMNEINRLRWDPIGFPNPDIQDKARELVRRLRAGDHLRGEEWDITVKNGTTRTVAVSTNSLAIGDERVHILALITDLTRQKLAENERLALERRTQHVQKIESLGAMAGGIAHDFNNILMVILGNIELATAKTPASSILRTYLRDMEKSVFMAAELTRKILAYTGKTSFIITAVDLSLLAEEVLHAMAGKLPAEIGLDTRLTQNLPVVKGDAAKICQILTNLITNAAEAYPPGTKGRITLSTGSRYCKAEDLAQTIREVAGNDSPPSEGIYVFLEVTDKAGGMDENAVRRVFDPFFTTKFQGRGLGMSTVLGIVRGLRGAIRITSTPGKGTTVRVLFPTVGEDEPVMGRIFSDGVSSRIDSPRTILLVDDEFKIRKLAQTMLQKLGYRVLTAGNGQEAIRIYREKYREIHCVLLDLSMPEMSGREVFENLRRLDPEVCIILSSGYTEQDVMDQFRGEDPSGFIQKPYRFQMLGRKMKAVLRVSRGNR